MKLIKTIEDKIKRIKSRFDYKTKYHEAVEEIEDMLKTNNKLQKRINELEFNLEKDNQARKIEELQRSNEYHILKRKEYREETIKLNNKIFKQIKETDKLTKQLEYLRSGEYYKQLKFERDILQSTVDSYKQINN